MHWCMLSSGSTEQDVFLTALVETKSQDTPETAALQGFTDLLNDINW